MDQEPFKRLGHPHPTQNTNQASGTSTIRMAIATPRIARNQRLYMRNLRPRRPDTRRIHPADRLAHPSISPCWRQTCEQNWETGENPCHSHCDCHCGCHCHCGCAFRCHCHCDCFCHCQCHCAWLWVLVSDFEPRLLKAISPLEAWIYTYWPAVGEQRCLSVYLSVCLPVRLSVCRPPSFLPALLPLLVKLPLSCLPFHLSSASMLRSFHVFVQFCMSQHHSIHPCIGPSVSPSLSWPSCLGYCSCWKHRKWKGSNTQHSRLSSPTHTHADDPELMLCQLMAKWKWTSSPTSHLTISFNLHPASRQDELQPSSLLPSKCSLR